MINLHTKFKFQYICEKHFIFMLIKNNWVLNIESYYLTLLLCLLIPARAVLDCIIYSIHAQDSIQNYYLHTNKVIRISDFGSF